MPELIHCHCRRKSAGSPRIRALPRSIRTTILRDYSGITVIDHPIGEINEVEGGWYGIGAMVIGYSKDGQCTTSSIYTACRVVSSFLSVGLEDATDAGATPLPRAQLCVLRQVMSAAQLFFVHLLIYEGYLDCRRYVIR